jgi:bromodomain-containing factor 1
MKKPAHNAIAWPFLLPVDPVAWNIIGYFDVVKHPMDISTVEKKLNNGEYKDTAEFEADVRLIFHNCYIFNTPDNEVYQMGQALEAVFNERWNKKAPPAATPVPTPAPAAVPKKVMSAKGMSYGYLSFTYVHFPFRRFENFHNLTSAFFFFFVSRETH